MEFLLGGLVGLILGGALGIPLGQHLQVKWYERMAPQKKKKHHDH